MKMKAVSVIFYLVLFFISNNAAEEDSFVTNQWKNSTVRKARFISFNRNDGDVKVELDFTIPFIKIPLGRRSDGTALTKPNIDISVQGILISSIMLFLFFTIVPKIVTLFLPHAQVTSASNLLPYMSRIDEQLRQMDMSPSECYQRSVCWLASKSQEGSNGFNYDQALHWFDRVLGNDLTKEAYIYGSRENDCTVFKCSLSLSNMANMMKFGNSLFT